MPDYRLSRRNPPNRALANSRLTPEPSGSDSTSTKAAAGSVGRVTALCGICANCKSFLLAPRRRADRVRRGDPYCKAGGTDCVYKRSSMDADPSEGAGPRYLASPGRTGEWSRSLDGAKDDRVSCSARTSKGNAASKAEVGTLAGDNRQDCPGRFQQANKAEAFRKEYLERVEGGMRLRWRLHHSEGSCSGEQAQTCWQIKRMSAKSSRCNSI